MGWIYVNIKQQPLNIFAPVTSGSPKTANELALRVAFTHVIPLHYTYIIPRRNMTFFVSQTNQEKQGKSDKKQFWEMDKPIKIICIKNLHPIKWF